MGYCGQMTVGWIVLTQLGYERRIMEHYTFNIHGKLIAGDAKQAETIFRNISSWLDILQIPQFKLTYSTERILGKGLEPPPAT